MDTQQRQGADTFAEALERMSWRGKGGSVPQVEATAEGLRKVMEGVRLDVAAWASPWAEEMLGLEWDVDLAQEEAVAGTANGIRIGASALQAGRKDLGQAIGEAVLEHVRREAPRSAADGADRTLVERLWEGSKGGWTSIGQIAPNAIALPDALGLMREVRRHMEGDADGTPEDRIGMANRAAACMRAVVERDATGGRTGLTAVAGTWSAVEHWMERHDVDQSYEAGSRNGDWKHLCDRLAQLDGEIWG